MSSTTVAEFASELKKSTETLLDQLKSAGVPKASASDALTDGDKQKLLSFLQASHGTATADRKKITLVKKSTSEIKQADATGKARTIQVEVRKKRTFIKRDDDGVVAAETATVHEDTHGAAPLIDEAELSRREEEARRQAELIRRQEEELAERRRQREAQEAREREQVEQVERAEKAAAAAAAQERQSQAVTPTGEAPVPAPASAAEAASATAASDRAAALEKSREDARAKAAADSKAKADEEALRANDLIERRQKALAEAEAIRAMMNAPKRVLVPHKAEPKPVAKADEAKPGMKGTLHKPAGAPATAVRAGGGPAAPAGAAPGNKEVKSAKLSSSWAGDPAKKKAIPTRGDASGGVGRNSWRGGPRGRRGNDRDQRDDRGDGSGIADPAEFR